MKDNLPRKVNDFRPTSLYRIFDLTIVTLLLEKRRMNINILTPLFLVLVASPVFGQSPKILDENMEVEIKELPQLNSSARETNISITPNGKTMFYMSDRGQMPWSQNYGTWHGKPRYDGDIWCSEKRGDEWGKPYALGQPVNTENGEDEPNVSPNGTKVYFQSWLDTWENDGGPYYTANLFGTSWSQPKGLGGGITEYFKKEFQKYRTYATDGMSISPDGRRFIVAAGVDYDGRLDFYMSTRPSVTAPWGKMKKLNLSTGGDERSAFWGSDGKTLFFSSSGYGGFGGLDIFKTTINDNGSHGEIVNLGSKFNTARDDYGFIMTASGKEAYFVRDGDIYQAILKDPPEELLPSPTAMVFGEVKTDKGEMQKVKITLFNKTTNEEMMYTHTFATDGKYTIYLPDASQDYFLQMSQHGEVVEEKDVILDHEELYNEIQIDFIIPTEEFVEEHPIVDKRVFDNIYFRSGSDRIEMKGMVKLNNVIKYLKEHPDVFWLITAFPDEHGNSTYNENLARRRAHVIADHLISRGVPEDRISLEHFKKAQQETVHSDTKLTRFIFNQVEISIITRSGNVNSPDAGVRAITEEKTRSIVVPEEEAHPDVEDALKSSPDNAAEYLERGYAHALEGKYSEAISDYTKAWELDPDNAEILHFRGMAKREKGDYASALQDYNKFLEMEPDNDAARFSRSQLLIKVGKESEACSELEIIESEYPELAAPFIKNYCNK